MMIIIIFIEIVESEIHSVDNCLAFQRQIKSTLSSPTYVLINNYRITCSLRNEKLEIAFRV